MRRARAPPACWFLPRRTQCQQSLDTEQLSGLPNSCVLAFVMLALALHPCQQAASHLACTWPPDFVDSRCSFLVLPTASSSSSSRSATPARWALLAGRRAASHGLRATCIRRAASSGGFLATSFRGLQHFHGPHILYGRPCSPAKISSLYSCFFYVRCSRTHPHFWERTSSVCIIHLCSVFARHHPFSSAFPSCVFLFSLLTCTPMCCLFKGLYIWRAIYLEGYIYLEGS